MKRFATIIAALALAFSLTAFAAPAYADHVPGHPADYDTCLVFLATAREERDANFGRAMVAEAQLKQTAGRLAYVEGQLDYWYPHALVLEQRIETKEAKLDETRRRLHDVIRRKNATIERLREELAASR